MALDKDRLGTNILAALTALGANATADQIWITVSDEIIKEIKDNAELIDIDAYKAFLLGSPSAGDGGASLQTTWSLPTNTISGGKIE